jgi:branched-chain amino acid transport system permease protein
VIGKFGVSLLNGIGIGALVALGLVMLTGVGGATSFRQAACHRRVRHGWLTSVQGVSRDRSGVRAAADRNVALAIGALTLRLGGHFLPLSTIAWGLSIALFRQCRGARAPHGSSNIPALNLFGSLWPTRAVYYLIGRSWGSRCCSATTCCSRPGRAVAACAAGRSAGQRRRRRLPRAPDAFVARALAGLWAGCTPMPTAS